MFGPNKPAFGQQATGTGFGFGAQTAATSPFGQTSFGKPAATSFGQTPAFGSQNTSLFGSTQPNTGGLFGTTNTSGFGSTAPATQSAFGGFTAPQQANSLFGATNQNANTSLFGQNTTSAFGAATKPSGFGFGPTQQPTSLFGQSTTASTSATNFGGFGQNTTSGGVFGAPNTAAFGQNAAAPNAGTSIAKYQPALGTDTLMKNGQPNNVSTKQHCITAMREYEQKSLEELRMEDYLANRKGVQAGNTGGLFGQTQAPTGGLFGPPAQQQSTGLFGQTQENKGLFGSSLGATGFGQTAATGFGATNQPAAGGLFAKPFAAPATSSAGFGGFGTTNSFGPTAATGLFGQTQQPAQAAPSAFGQPSTGFGVGFGSTNPNQNPSLFGNTTTTQAAPAFGMTSTANTGFGGFGANTNTSSVSGGLFGSKPATAFGNTTAFGAPTSTATGFAGFGTQNTAGSFFNTTLNKPAAPAFGGFGTQTTSAPIGGGLSFGNTNQSSMFGNTANKPGGLFGNTGTTGTGLFGGGSAFGGTSAFGGIGSNPLGGMVTTMGGTQQQTSIPIHQQIQALATLSYGDNPLFKDLKPIGDERNEALKPTNPAAQKALLELSANNHFKVSPQVGGGIKVKPVGGPLKKKSLFDGLEENDGSVDFSFTLKPSRRRLVLKQKPPNESISLAHSSTSSNASSKTHLGISNADHITEKENSLKRPSLPSHKAASTSNSSPKPGSTTVTRENVEIEESNTGAKETVTTSTANEIDSTRRESWLHLNPLSRVREQNRLTSDNEVMDNTLSELVAGKNKSLKTISEECLPASKSQLSERTESFIASESYLNESSLSFHNLDESNEEIYSQCTEPQPAGIVLRRIGYYIRPALDELPSYLTEDGKCVVPNFTIGRTGYGNVFFNEPIDIAGLNFDEIVHFRHKEVIIYPDDENKPPVGSGLNRKAQITLDQVWPHDKTIHEPIKDPERLIVMGYEEKLRRVCDKHDTRFIEYRAETGSWVFKVEHFSKYGLSDSDEDDAPADPKKIKMTVNGKSTGAIKKVKESSETLKMHKKPTGLEKFTSDADRIFQGGMNDISFTPGFDRQGGHGQSYNAHAMSPTALLAMKAGTDSHKLQLMKASFFNDDEMDKQSVISDHFDGRGSPDQIVPNKTSVRTLYSSTSTLGRVGRDLDGSASSLNVLDEMREDIEYQKIRCSELLAEIPPLVVRPQIAKVKLNAAVVPLGDSFIRKIIDLKISNATLFNCRRFKLSFGKGNQLSILTTSQNPISIGKDTSVDLSYFNNFFRGRKGNDKSNSIAQIITIPTTEIIEKFQQSIEDHLEIQLNNSLQSDSKNTDCPHIKNGGGAELIGEHLKVARKNINLSDFEEYTVSVWSLCQVLWGEQEELEGQEASSHLTVMCRRNLFSGWLEDNVTDKDQLKKQVSKTDYLDHLLSLLHCHKVAEACELAFTHDDANLALILAQMSSGPTVRQLVLRQLVSWNENEADSFISQERLRMLMLVAGETFFRSSHGVINVLQDVDWLKALALNLWYICSYTSSITDALLAYEKALNNSAHDVASPKPVYADENESSEPYDLRYHILKLFSRKSHPLEKLLNPATYTSDIMDFRLSWLLLQTFESLGYHHCSLLAESQIHTSFASQLENYGLWHWSIFILLHIKNREQRELCVQQVLYRYIDLRTDSEYLNLEDFIINRLGIPAKWIFWAKAVKAGSMRRYHDQAKYLLRAKQWSLAHEVVMEHIAPQAVINDNVEYLRGLLYRFQDPRKVSNWSNQGQILLDFIEMNEKFESLKTIHEGDIITHSEILKPQLNDLCSRIKLFPCPTPRHRLCQSEIAQKLACLIRVTQLTSPEVNACLLIKTALERLPLPQEYAQQQLRYLIDAYVNDVVAKSSEKVNVK